MYSHNPDPKIVADLTRIKKLVLLAVALVSAVTLLGWFVRDLQKYAPDYWFRMVAYTALNMGFACASFLLTAAGRSQTSVFVGKALALFVFAYGLATLCEFAFDVSWGYDQWLPFRQSLHPGRPAPPTLRFFAVVGIAILFSNSGDSLAGKISDLATTLSILISIYLVAAYLYGAVEAIGVDSSTLTAPNTVFCICGLSFALAIRRASCGSVYSYLVNIGIGGRAVRGIIPMILTLPLAGFAWVGYVVNYNVMAPPLARAFAGTVEAFAMLLIVIWLAKRIHDMEGELVSLSLTDELTGINNRRGFYLLGEAALRHIQRDGSRLSVVFFDLDGLKKINDNYGHDIGSQFVREFASLLRTSFRASDILGRVGGDEFAVIIMSGEAENALRRLSAATEAMNQNPKKKYSISYSFGAVSITPDGTESFSEVVKKADLLMYEQKKKKKASGASISR